MTPERWSQVRAVLEDALEQAPSRRTTFIDERCAGDGELRDEVLSLLRSHEQAGGFLESPAVLEERPAPPTEAGAYRLLRPIGQGGMGSVFLAVRADDVYDKQVAVKFLEHGLGDAGLVRRFRAERQILAQLEHPGIARLLDGGTASDGRPYLVMEYVDGLPIDRYCDERRLPTRARLELFRRVCAAAHFAHQNLVVHRDLKPGNILVNSSGEPKLLDFGIAKMLASDTASDRQLTATELGRAPMTPEYASPEQVRGEPITTASDVYSLGVVLYELLCGHKPQRLASRAPDEVRRVVCEQEPERPSTVVGRGLERRRADGSLETLAPETLGRARDSDPQRLRRHLRGDLDTIVLKALRKDPRRRYTSAEQLAEDLERHLRGLPVLARPDTLAYRAGKFARRHRAALVATAAALWLLLAFTATLLLQRRETLRQRVRAEQVSRYLADLFALPDPTRARGERVTARQLLDRGAAEVRARLGAQPDVQGDLMETMGESYGNLGLYSEARQLLEDGLALRRRQHPAGHREVAHVQQKLADVLLLMGDYARAEQVQREALATRLRLARQADDADVAESQVRLARLLFLRGAYGEAQQRFEQAVAMARRLGDRARLAAALDRYGIQLVEQGRAAEAHPLLSEALALYRGLYGELHPEVALTLNNLGLLEAGRDATRAEAFLHQAERLQRQLYGDSHPNLATTLHNLALLYRDSGRFEQAERLFQTALEMRRGVYEGDHPRLATTLDSLAGLRAAQGRHAEAEELAREAAAMLERTLGPEHADTANTWKNLAQVLAGTGHTAEAETLYEHALPVLRRQLSEHHPRVASTLNGLADLRQSRGDARGAEQLYRQALVALEASGQDSAGLAVTLHNLASALVDQGDLAGAEQTDTRALALARAKLGPQHPHTAVIASSVAALHLRRGRPREAEPLARAALEALRQALPPGAAGVLAVERILADSLVGQRRFAEAETLLQASWRGLRASRDQALLDAEREALVRLYEAWGRPGVAATLRAGGPPPLPAAEAAAAPARTHGDE